MFHKLIVQTSNNRGMALVATLILVLVITSFAIALLSLTSSDIKLSSLQEEYKKTFYIAEAGLDRAIAFLEELGNPSFPNPVNPFENENGGSPVVGEGTYTVSIRSETPLSYFIKSKGEKTLSASKKVKVEIESLVTLDNFAMFAYFSDKETLPDFISFSGDRNIWFISGDTIEGKLHSNDRLHMSGNPVFYDKVTSAYSDGKGDLWEAHKTHGAQPDFRGIPPYTGGVKRIDLPDYRKVSEEDDANSLHRIAAGSQKFIDDHPDSGVYIPTDKNNNVSHGILVKGNVTEMILGTDAASGNPKIIIDQSTSSTPNKKVEIYTIEKGKQVVLGGEEYNSGTVVGVYNNITKKYDYTNYSGHTNGLIYVNGEIASLHSNTSSGGVKGTYTIASNDDINITDDILYNSRIESKKLGVNCFEAEEGKYPDFPDSLGLVTEGNIVIGKYDQKNAPKNLEINAILMALGSSFYYQGFDKTLKGTLEVHGSFIQNQRGPVGQLGSNGLKQYGYSKNYHFDSRMNIHNPKFGEVLPPFFPTTGKYIKLWWKEV